MILCLDVGNTHIYGGVFHHKELHLRFRIDSQHNYSSDQYGVFIKSILRENHIEPNAIQHISMCSVVPEIDYSIKAACKKYFDIYPFALQPGVKTKLKIKYRNPIEVGADRIANAIAATRLFQKKPLLIVDLGTATTICAISSQLEYLGGVILSGMRLSMNALQANTAKLPSVQIIKPKQILGRSTAESIQSGLYYGQLASIKQILSQITSECFPQAKDDLKIIGTGGFAQLFAEEDLFTHIEPHLVLKGLFIAFEENFHD